MIFESLIASVVAPAAIDLVKSTVGALSRRWAGLSVDDQIKLQNADISKLEALAKLDTPVGTPSQWVVDLRASFRYIAAPLVILFGGIVLVAGLENPVNEMMIEAGASLVSMPFGFIFGERLYLGLKSIKK
jgi:hypothetical protein